MIYAPDIWNRIVASAHKYAEPGIAFIDEVNRHNHLMASMGPINSCNPCGEQFLHANNSCNLGSIDVSKFHAPIIAKHVTSTGTTCGTSYISAPNSSTMLLTLAPGRYPEIEDTVKRTRPVGLGIMGFADLCLKLKITYGSPESCALWKK